MAEAAVAIVEQDRFFHLCFILRWLAGDREGPVDLGECLGELLEVVVPRFVGLFESCFLQLDGLVGAELGEDGVGGLDDSAELWVSAEGGAIGAVDEELSIRGDLDGSMEGGFGAR